MIFFVNILFLSLSFSLYLSILHMFTVNANKDFYRYLLYTLFHELVILISFTISISFYRWHMSGSSSAGPGSSSVLYCTVLYCTVP